MIARLAFYAQIFYLDSTNRLNSSAIRAHTLVKLEITVVQL